MIDVRQAFVEIEDQLRNQIPETLMAGYVGEVTEPVPTPPDDSRVKAYWAMWVGPGRLDNSRLYPSNFVDVLTFTVTVAGGTPDRVLLGVGEIRKALAGIEIASGLISEQAFDPGPLRLDMSITPARHFVPLSYQLEP